MTGEPEVVMESLYRNPHQARTRPPSAYEEKLAGAIEEIFASGVHDLEGLVTGLRQAGVRAPDGTDWTVESFTTEMQRLGGE